jgi:hypothetical protein
MSLLQRAYRLFSRWWVNKVADDVTKADLALMADPELLPSSRYAMELHAALLEVAPAIERELLYHPMTDSMRGAAEAAATHALHEKLPWTKGRIYLVAWFDHVRRTALFDPRPESLGGARVVLEWRRRRLEGLRD